jgi:hypothetical protein
MFRKRRFLMIANNRFRKPGRQHGLLRYREWQAGPA